MRILFLSQLLPWPLDAGPKIRSFYVLRYLVEAGHDVTMVCFVRAHDRCADIDAIRRLGVHVETVPIRRSRLRDAWSAGVSFATPTPFLIRRDRAPEMSARLAAVATRTAFDAVHADQLWMAPYALACAGVPLKVLDQHNAVFRVPERLAAGQCNAVVRRLLRREARKLERFERSAMNQFDHVVWVSALDRDAFGEGRLRTGATESVIPIAVDPRARGPVERARPFRVTFVGGLHWPPNAEGVRWFLGECWSHVAAAVPDAVFTVVGHGGIATPSATPRVEVLGYVSDLSQVMAETAVFVVPLLAGAGMRVKILEAWCWGVPVVSTTIGAEGIASEGGDALVLADDPRAFSDAVVRVFGDRCLSQRLAAGGRAAVEAQYDWSHCYRAWDEVYAQ